MIPEDLRHALESEFGYPRKGAELVANKLDHLSPQIARLLEQWWITREIPALELEGYTVERLMREHSMNPIAAFLTMDWILREPTAATTSLHRGKDEVRWRPRKE